MTWECSSAGRLLARCGARGLWLARGAYDDRFADDLLDPHERVVRDRATVPRARDLFDEALADEAAHLARAGRGDADRHLGRAPDELGRRRGARRLLRVEKPREHVDDAPEDEPSQKAEERAREDAVAEVGRDRAEP